MILLFTNTDGVATSIGCDEANGVALGIGDESGGRRRGGRSTQPARRGGPCLEHPCETVGPPA